MWRCMMLKSMYTNKTPSSLVLVAALIMSMDDPLRKMGKVEEKCSPAMLAMVATQALMMMLPISLMASCSSSESSDKLYGVAVENRVWGAMERKVGMVQKPRF